MKTTKDGYPILNREELNQLLHAKSDKGILVMGLPGTGKTYALKTQRMVTATDLAIDYQSSGLQAVKEYINTMIAYESLTVTIDDLGNEPRVKHFGNALDPVEWALLKIYSINQKADTSIKLRLTTNFNIESLTDIYGSRVVDRLHEMCDIVVLEDTNLRRSPIK